MSRSCISLLFLSAAAHSQDGPASHTLYEFTGGAAGEQFGRAVAGVGDMDGDGRAELGLGAPFAPVGGVPSGRVELRSGAHGALRFELAGSRGEQLGTSLAGPGDVDGDGLAELAIGAVYGGGGAQGCVRLVSGASGAVLVVATGEAGGDRFGDALAAVGDLDGDGRGDLLVGARTNDAIGTSSGAAYALSGATGGVLLASYGPARGEMHGWSVAAAGDVDGDGTPDLLVGAPTAWSGARARVLSGASGALLREWKEPAGALFGNALAGGADLDADGVPDVVIGAPFDASAGAYAGRVSAHSGASGAELWRVHGVDSEGFLGEELELLPDVDGDGVHEVAAGAPAGPGVAGRVSILSGSDGSPALELVGAIPGGGFGVALSSAGDLNADGVPDLLVGASAKALEGAAAGGGHALSTQALLLSSNTHELALSSGSAQTLELSAGALQAGATYVVLGSLGGSEPGLSLGGAHLPLVPDAYLWLTLLDAAASPLSQSVGVLDASGQAQCSFVASSALPPSLAGKLVHHAAVVLGPATLLTSPAVPLGLLP